MSEPAATNSEQDRPSADDRTIQEFFLWALATLGLPVRQRNGLVYETELPEQDRQDFGGVERLQFTFGSRDRPDASVAESVSPSCALFDWVVHRLRALECVVHAVPAGQPTSVHELSGRLFGAYTVQGGRVRLGGCTLDDQPLMRFTYRIRSHRPNGDTRLAHVYVSADGQRVADELLGRLQVDRLAPYPGKPPRVSAEQLQRCLEAGVRHAPAVAEGEEAEPLVVAVVWCKYFRCKLLFEIGDARAELPFEGWAQLLVDGAIDPPPFRCAATGRVSYRVAATDDGRVSVAEAIVPCEESGRRVLVTDLETCEATGRRVAPEWLRSCPVTGARVARSAMVACNMCRQEVSPRAIAGGRCQACRNLRPVNRDDPRMARVLGEYPKLDRWTRWRMVETHTAYILVATSLLRRLLVVLDRESLDVLQLSEGSRIGRRWPDVPAGRWPEYLG